MTQANAVLGRTSSEGRVADGAATVRHGRAFLAWWLSELQALLPERARKRLAGDDRRAALVFEGDALRLTDLRGGQVRPICRMDLAGMSASEGRDAIRRALSRAGLSHCSLVLGLPEHLLLRKRESLPAGAERRLGDILRLQLENTAPLPSGSFYWGYRPAGQETDGRLNVDCVLVKTEPVDAMAARLADLNIELSAIIPESDLPGEPTLNLLPAHLRKEPEALWSPLNRGLAVLAGALAVLAVVLTFYRQESRLEALNAELADLRSRAQNVLAMRAEAQEQLEAVAAVRTAKTTAPPLMGILDEISRLLPDGTWVNSFRLRDGEVQLIGQTQSAASLIGQLEGSRMFADVHFGSPVVRDQKTGEERFNIQFDWVDDSPKTAQAGTREGDGK